MEFVIENLKSIQFPKCQEFEYQFYNNDIKYISFINSVPIEVFMFSNIFSVDT